MGLAEDPLLRFAVFQTRSSEEFRDVILNKFLAERVAFNAPSSFAARGSLAEFETIALVYGSCNNSVRIEYPEAEYFRLVTAITGKGGILLRGSQNAADKSQSCIVPANHRVQIAGIGSHSWLTLRVKASALAARFAAITGLRPTKLEFDSVVRNDKPELTLLRELIFSLAHETNRINRPASLIVRGLEDLVLTAFLRLSLQSSSTLEKEPNFAAESQVRIAADYLEANWSRSVTVEEIAAIANIGARSLFRSFRKVHGCSPMVFAKRVRLRRARDMLTAAAPGTAVTSVSLLCGFSNAGHFAHDYKSYFGELPSETLGRFRKELA